MTDKDTHNRNDSDFIDKARSALDESVDNLDTNTVARLRAIRKQALQETEDKRFFVFTPGLAATGAFATVAIAVSLWLAFPVTTHEIFDTEDVLLLSANEDLELIDELEFYDWLANEEKHT